MTWSEILRRFPIQYGDLEYSDDDYVYRGPVAYVTESDTLISFTLGWLGRRSKNGPDTSWAKVREEGYVIATTAPTSIVNGQILVHGLAGLVTIYPVGTGKLHPREVSGIWPDTSHRS